MESKGKRKRIRLEENWWRNQVRNENEKKIASSTGTGTGTAKHIRKRKQKQKLSNFIRKKVFCIGENAMNINQRNRVWTNELITFYKTSDATTRYRTTQRYVPIRGFIANTHITEDTYIHSLPKISWVKWYGWYGWSSKLCLYGMEGLIWHYKRKEKIDSYGKCSMSTDIRIFLFYSRSSEIKNLL